jgi:hypothetical protein
METKMVCKARREGEEPILDTTVSKVDKINKAMDKVMAIKITEETPSGDRNSIQPKIYQPKKLKRNHFNSEDDKFENVFQIVILRLNIFYCIYLGN